MERQAERGYTVEELIQAGRRRARPAFLVFGAVLVVGAVVVAALPDEYRAEATIILEPYRPHAELVTPAVTTMLEDRLRVARQQLLSGPHLARVVERFHLFADLVGKRGPDAGVEALRRHLEVKPDGESAIVVSFRTEVREQAAPVVAAVARGFAEANAELRIGQSRRVVDILGEELQRVTRELDGHERTVRDFRLAHDGELPEQVETNLREAERATHQLDGAEGWLRDVDRRRSQVPLTATSPEVERLATIESDLVRQLNHARAMFSDDHPEPVRLSRELDGLTRLREEAGARAEGTARERAAVEREWGRARGEVAGLEARAKAARDRAAAAARWGAELVVLERDRDLLREKYHSLASRKVEGEVALGLEERAAPLATNVVDPPSDPAGPAAPDRLRLLVAVLALASGLALGAGVWLESKDLSVRTPAQARAQLGVPLLAVVPSLSARRA